MTLSITALEALTQSAEAWESYRGRVSGPIDLTLAQLRGVDLHGRTFSFCDLSGADLDSANLDGCSFSHTALKSASLRNASLVSCEFDHVDGSDAIFEDAVVRSSRFASTNLTRANFKGAAISQSVFGTVLFELTKMDHVRFLDSSFRDSDFKELQSHDVGLRSCEFSATRMFSVHWPKVTIVDCEIKGARIRDLEFSHGVISNLRIIDADLYRFLIKDSEVDHLDFTRSTLCETDLGGIDLPHSTMLDTAIIHCQWPRQRARISWSGHYEKSPLLLGQPVQDLRGLSPSLRREIADAQYLDELASRSTGLPKRIAFRIWGATTAYGQSILRLSTVTLLIIIALSVALLVNDPQIVGLFQKIKSLPSAMKVVSAHFLGIEGPARTQSSRFQDIVLVVSRVGGFFVMGLWIGVAANRLGRLSSE